MGVFVLLTVVFAGLILLQTLRFLRINSSFRKRIAELSVVHGDDSRIVYEMKRLYNETFGE
jgi:hypothetical protein